MARLKLSAGTVGDIVGHILHISNIYMTYVTYVYISEHGVCLCLCVCGHVRV